MAQPTSKALTNVANHRGRCVSETANARLAARTSSRAARNVARAERAAAATRVQVGPGRFFSFFFPVWFFLSGFSFRVFFGFFFLFSFSVF